jgi:hypothetical protein
MFDAKPYIIDDGFPKQIDNGTNFTADGVIIVHIRTHSVDTRTNTT